MIDGTYQVVLKTPMGAKKGDLVLIQDDQTLNGKMVIMGKENPISSGTTDGENFSFAGELQTAVGRLSFTCEGRVEGDTLTAQARTKKGIFRMTGSRK